MPPSRRTRLESVSEVHLGVAATPRPPRVPTPREYDGTDRMRAVGGGTVLVTDNRARRVAID